MDDPQWLLRVENEDDPAVRVYSNLKDAHCATRKGLFIAEGPETLLLLLRSPLTIVSLCLKPSIFDRLRPQIEQALQGPSSSSPFTVFVCARAVMDRIVGYPVARGALAAGIVPRRDLSWVARTLLPSLGIAPLPDVPLPAEAALAAAAPSSSDGGPGAPTPEGHGARPAAGEAGRSAGAGRLRVLAVERSGDEANLGGMVRSAAALGCQLVLVGSASCDAWYRRAVRCSMGHVFFLPVVRCHLPAALAWLRDACGVVSYAAVIDADAAALRGLRGAPRRWCLCVGHEEAGVTEAARKECGGGGLRIGMAPGVDSLNVGIAAGILLNGLVEREEEDDEKTGSSSGRDGAC